MIENGSAIKKMRMGHSRHNYIASSSGKLEFRRQDCMLTVSFTVFPVARQYNASPADLH